MPTAELDLIFESQTSFVRRRTLGPGQILFALGSQVRSIFRIVSGTVRIEAQPEDGRRIVVYRALSGELVGVHHLTRKFYVNAATVDERTVVDMVSCDTVLKFVRENETHLRAFLECLARRQEKICESLERISIPSAKFRVLHLLESLTRRIGFDSLDLRGRVKSLSGDLNLTHEATYRALRTLEAEGFIRREDGRICVLRQHVSQDMEPRWRSG